MTVLKFGGTSAGSAEAIRLLTDIVKINVDAGKKPMVVCSAMSGVTNSLIGLTRSAAYGENADHEILQLRNKHHEILREFSLDKEAASGQVDQLFSELELLIGGIAALRECTLRTLDRVMAFGEQLSCTLIAAVLNQNIGNAVYVDARKLIVTNSNFGNAQVDEPTTNRQISDWHAGIGDAIPVITGFIAGDNRGQTTTLGRGGSDFTAAMFGACLQADELQVWTDVDGFMTADPRMVKNAFTLPEISYREAMELSYFGAKVIYPPTLIPAIAKNIPIRIRNTFNASHPGTTIVPQVSYNGTLIKGISSIGRISLINVEGSGMVGVKGFGGRLFGAIASANVNVILITQASSEHSISFAVSPEDTGNALTAIRNEFEMELLTKKVDPPKAIKDHSIMAVVGENMRHTKGLAGKLFQALGRSGVNIVAIAQGSSELNISVVIDQDDLAKALNAVHDALFLSPVKTLHLFLAGTGNIGSELLKQLEQSEKHLKEEHHQYLKVMGVTNSRKMLFAGNGGIDLNTWPEELNENGIEANIHEFVDRIEKLNLPNSIFVDNTSNPTLVEQYAKLFAQNVSVVACNKLGASGTFSFYQNLKRRAQKHGVDFYYETNVGAGLPIIKTMNDLLISGDHFLKIEAILSGTISFIFNNYKGDVTFAEVVKQAQEHGYTEPDPRDDLNGMDFARKMLILARETGLPLEMKDIHLEPILPDACLEAPSISIFYDELANAEPHFAKLKSKAAAEGLALRYIGEIADQKVQIRLAMVDREHPFFSMSGSDNIISFTTMRYKNNPLVVKGPGAGAAVTAAGVFADILRVAAF